MKLSVLMITYNHERFIAQALEGILAQNVDFEYEIVVGEDCSTDRTREILNDFCSRYPGKIVPLIRDRNIGMMRNLEETLSRCRGQYIAVIEGDDYWTSPDKLQKQVDFLNTHSNYSLCCHRVRVVNEMGEGERPTGPGVGQSGILPPRSAGTYTLEDLLAENFIMTCTILYRNGAVGALPDWFLKLKLGDWPLCALIARSGPIYLMDEVMAAYRVHPGGVWSSQSSIVQLTASIRMLRALDEYLGFKYHDIIRRTIARFCLYAARVTREKGDHDETMQFLCDFFRNGGWQFPECRPELRALAGTVVFGSWHGMSITTQMIQLLLRKFGYEAVREKSEKNHRKIKIRRI